jgi:hypothetical protein
MSICRRRRNLTIANQGILVKRKKLRTLKCNDSDKDDDGRQASRHIASPP